MIGAGVHDKGHARLTPLASTFLDLARAASACLVVVAHINSIILAKSEGFIGGAVGVVIFFLISGFLITQSLLSRRANPVGLPNFLADRFARIMAAYLPTLILIAIANAWLIHGQVGGAGLSRGPLALVGNALMLQDYPVFQILDVVHHGVDWRIRPYNTAEPLWTVAIEFWIYVAVGLMFFCVLHRRRVRVWPVVGLALVSLPVVVWNAGAGGGQCLSLVWGLGAIAGQLLFWHFELPVLHQRQLAALVMGLAGTALAIHGMKFGVQMYDFQTASLAAIVFFGAVSLLNTWTCRVVILQQIAGRLACYSYSLYLVHDTIVWVVSAYIRLPATFSAGLAFGLSHIVALGLYFLFERHHRRLSRLIRPVFSALLLPPPQSDESTDSIRGELLPSPVSLGASPEAAQTCVLP